MYEERKSKTHHQKQHKNTRKNNTNTNIPATPWISDEIDLYSISDTGKNGMSIKLPKFCQVDLIETDNHFGKFSKPLLSLQRIPLINNYCLAIFTSRTTGAQTQILCKVQYCPILQCAYVSGKIKIASRTTKKPNNQPQSATTQVDKLSPTPALRQIPNGVRNASTRSQIGFNDQTTHILAPSQQSFNFNLHDTSMHSMLSQKTLTQNKENMLSNILNSDRINQNTLNRITSDSCSPYIMNSSVGFANNSSNIGTPLTPLTPKSMTSKILSSTTDSREGPRRSSRTMNDDYNFTRSRTVNSTHVSSKNLPTSLKTVFHNVKSLGESFNRLNQTNGRPTADLRHLNNLDLQSNRSDPTNNRRRRKDKKKDSVVNKYYFELRLTRKITNADRYIMRYLWKGHLHMGDSFATIEPVYEAFVPMDFCQH